MSPGSYQQTIQPLTNTNSTGSTQATSSAGPQQNGGPVTLTSGVPVNLPNTIVSTITVAPSGLIAVTQATTTNNAATLTFSNQTANTFFAGPTTGAAAAPVFRAIGNTDLPGTNYSGTVALAKITGGGTDGSITVVNGAITAYVAPT